MEQRCCRAGMRERQVSTHRWQPCLVVSPGEKPVSGCYLRRATQVLCQRWCCPAACVARARGTGVDRNQLLGLTLETLCPNAPLLDGPSAGGSKAAEPASREELPGMQACGCLGAGAALRAHPRAALRAHPGALAGLSALDFAVCLGQGRSVAWLTICSSSAPSSLRWPGSMGLLSQPS